MTIIAAADGSALGNPGPAGWAWYADPTHWASGGWPHGTNNMGELMAVLDLLRSTAHLDEPLLVYCDSRYVIDSITKWMPGWKKKGWKKKDGKPVLNVDLMKDLDAAMAGRDVTFEWVKGHSGHHLNEEADQRANAAAVAFKEGRDPDAGPGWPDAEVSDLPASLELETVEVPESVEAGEPAEEAPEPVEAVLAAERSLLDDDVRRDRATLEALLHPAWTLLADSGRLWTRQEWLDRVGPAGEVAVEVVESDVVDADTVLLVWRGHDRLGTAVHATWWVRAEVDAEVGAVPGAPAWVQRFHHVSRLTD